MKAEISGVVPGSIAEELGVEKGDLLISINGIFPVDLLDYRYLSADQYIDLEIEKSNLERIILEIEKDEDEDLGIVFHSDTFDGIKRCKNKCIFCFVDQMPGNLRNSLYLKDDDFRLSFLYGNFITLTNVSAKDISRIKNMRISPLYISVHSTNAQTRAKMLKNPKACDIVTQLTSLAQAGIEMHTQIVLCPGINDEKDLEETVRELAKLWPQVQSVAIVPVGVTKFQKNSLIRPFHPVEAQKIVKTVSRWRKSYKNSIGNNFVHLSDEFYLMTKSEIPAYEDYEGFPQIENGVGLVRSLWHSFEQAEGTLPKSIEHPDKFTLVTGSLASSVLRPIVDRLNQIDGLTVDLVSIPNDFFGNTVTVAGLLTGHDLILGLHEWRKQQKQVVPQLLIPSTMLKYGENVFLDDISVEQVEETLQVKIKVADPTGVSLIKAVNDPGSK